jgi:hypothetical protein
MVTATTTIRDVSDGSIDDSASSSTSESLNVKVEDFANDRTVRVAGDVSDDDLHVAESATHTVVLASSNRLNVKVVVIRESLSNLATEFAVHDSTDDSLTGNCFTLSLNQERIGESSG